MDAALQLLLLMRMLPLFRLPLLPQLMLPQLLLVRLLLVLLLLRRRLEGAKRGSSRMASASLAIRLGPLLGSFQPPSQ